MDNQVAEKGCADSPFSRDGGVSRFLGDPQHPMGAGLFSADRKLLKPIAGMVNR
jgi:hypothetical protein